MEIVLNTALQKRTVLGIVGVLSLLYMVLVGRLFLASVFGERPELSSLQRAARIDTGNAEYRDHLGRYYALVARDPAAAIEIGRAHV